MSDLKAKRLSEEPGLKSFLQSETAAVVSLPITKAGDIHSAALLYATNDIYQFIFVTKRDTDKCKLLLEQEDAPAACVVGTTKGVSFSLQMRGLIKLVEKVDAAKELDVYEAKYGRRGDMPGDESDEVVLVFTPYWVRYTKYHGPDFKAGMERFYLKTFLS